MNKKKKFPLVIIIIVLTILLIVSMIVSITFGAVPIKSLDVAEILYYKIFNVGTNNAIELLQSARADIIWNIRFPRVLMGAVVGAGLSLSGVLMQAIVRNPLANPYILGVSSGASLGATMAIMLGTFSWLGCYGVSIGAFIGAIITSTFVFFIAFSGTGKGNTIKLLLAGMAINAMCSAFTSFIIYTSNNTEGIRSITFWTMGGLTSSSWNIIPIPTIVVLIISIIAITQFRVLNVLLVGEESAITMGVNIVKYRKIYLILSATVTGIVVAASGTIGFVGLIIPHIVRMIVGSNHKRVMPISILLGGIFLIWCDVFSRMFLQNSEIPIGIVTGMIGGPFFIYMMLTKSYGFGGE
ncbi:FecCD family ABC transporter permease [Clostridium rectalis]|uniref:FecCD family ABC transporter permease n=1 Tax=Clostridium rectalis TaxID=2040295 RepID=UPI000F640096|nr:iron ABC transporter permease [Clostridium rectalis]